MSFRLDFLPLLIAVTLASFACRAGGFWLMRFVEVTPRIQGALKAAPLGVMIGIMVPAAIRGALPEWLGLGAAALVMIFWRKDLVAALIGVATVALVRAATG